MHGAVPPTSQEAPRRNEALLTRRYQATHRTITMPDGRTDDMFEVREVYEGLRADGGDAWTDNAMGLFADTKDGLVRVLLGMLKDVQEFDVLEVGE